MATVTVNIPQDLMKWIRESLGKIHEKEWHFKPTDSQLIIHALIELKAYKTGKEFQIKYTKKGKCLIIKEN